METTNPTDVTELSYYVKSNAYLCEKFLSSFGAENFYRREMPGNSWTYSPIIHFLLLPLLVDPLADPLASASTVSDIPPSDPPPDHPLHPAIDDSFPARYRRSDDEKSNEIKKDRLILEDLKTYDKYELQVWAKKKRDLLHIFYQRQQQDDGDRNTPYTQNTNNQKISKARLVGPKFHF